MDLDIPFYVGAGILGFGVYGVIGAGAALVLTSFSVALAQSVGLPSN